LALHVIDTALTREIASGRIDVLEILRCDDIRFWAEVLDSPDKLDRRLFQRPPEKTTLRFVCDELGLSTPVWELEVSPPPTSKTKDFMYKILGEELLDSNLDKLFIVPGSTLHFHRRSKGQRVRRPAKVISK
jgi:hypothetical protein